MGLEEPTSVSEDIISARLATLQPFCIDVTAWGVFPNAVLQLKGFEQCLLSNLNSAVGALILESAHYLVL